MGFEGLADGPWVILEVGRVQVIGRVTIVDPDALGIPRSPLEVEPEVLEGIAANENVAGTTKVVRSIEDVGST